MLTLAAPASQAYSERGYRSYRGGDHYRGGARVYVHRGGRGFRGDVRYFRGPRFHPGGGYFRSHAYRTYRRPAVGFGLGFGLGLGLGHSY
jgi:hypothetical protein